MARPAHFSKGELADSHSLKGHFLDFKQEVRSSFESFTPELSPVAREKHGWRRVGAFARAMFFRLTPPRRVVLLCALLLLITSPFIPSGLPQISTYRLFLAALCLLILLAMELADRVALKRDLEVARDIQMWLLPRTPPSLPGLDIAFTTRPANTVAGDYYDVLVSDPSILLVIADVAGKGIPAGLVMAGFRASVHTLFRNTASLAGLAAALNRSCCEDSYGGRRFTTAFLVLYDPATRWLSYLNAGHNPPLLRTSGVIQELHIGGLPFGTFPKAIYDLGRIMVSPGDLLFMYTDGVVEALNEAGEEYGLERLRLFVGATDAPSDQCQQRLLAAIDAFTRRAPQHDDITCLICRFCG